MVRIEFDSLFKKKVSKIKDSKLKIRVLKQIEKIVFDPFIGKPMRYQKKGTREVYVKPFRLVYAYDNDILLLLFLDIYNKDNQ